MAENSIPPIPVEPIGESHRWREWFFTVRQIIHATTSAGSVLWSSINFTGSNLTSLATRNHEDLGNIQGGAVGDHSHLTAVQYGLYPSGTPSAGQVPIATSPTASAWGTLSYNHENLSGLQGGAVGEHSHLTAAQNTYLPTSFISSTLFSNQSLGGF